MTIHEVATGHTLGSVAVPGRLLALSPGGDVLAAVGDNEIVLLDSATLAEQGRLQGHADLIQDVQFSHGGRLVASASNDRTAIVWDVATHQPREQLQGHAGRVWGLDFSPDDTTLFTAGSDGTLLEWDLQGRRRWIPQHPLGEPVTIDAVTLVVSPTGEAVAYIAFPFTVQFIDVATGQASPVIKATGGDFGAWAWRPDGRRFATAGSDGYVRVWDWRTGELIAERQLATGHIAALDYTRDGELLLVGERAGSLYTIDPETLQPLSEPVHVKTGIVWGYVSPDSRRASPSALASSALASSR